jgi:thymidylate synthase ThyX
MSEISAKIIEDSINKAGCRLTTFVLKYPRFILAEVNTHRVFSRSSASSRAIPVKKMLEQVLSDPAMPIFWGKNQPGMSATEQLTGKELAKAKTLWIMARNEAVSSVRDLNDLGLHKQIANRILEPWMWTYTVLTATDFGNFYNLRLDPNAQPEMKQLAECMLEAHKNSVPRPVAGKGYCDISETHDCDWHLPFVTKEERDANEFEIEDLLKFSVARCARVSYANHEGVIDYAKDRILHDKLIASGHMSPLEHQAYPNMYSTEHGYIPIRDGNFRGWLQYRKSIPDENKSQFKF